MELAGWETQDAAGRPGDWFPGMSERLRALQLHFRIAHSDAPWDLLYVSSRDGYNLATLIDKGRIRSPLLLLLRDDGGRVLGALLHHPLEHNKSHYGSSRNLVFSLHPHFKVLEGKDRNRLYVLSNEKAIALGGVINGDVYGAALSIDR